jgi:hypothetical protein
MSCYVNYIRAIGNTHLPYIATVPYCSIPENTLESTQVLPRPSGTIPRPGVRKMKRDG